MGPLCDERVAGLVRRRFVPVFIDCDETGFAYDKDAADFVFPKYDPVKKTGKMTRAWSDVLFMTAGGDILARVHRFASSDTVLVAIANLRKDHPELDEPNAGENEAPSKLERARIQIELQNLEAAKKLLADEDTDDAHYLLGRLARLDGDWATMDLEFARVKGDRFIDDLTLEKAHRFWFDRDYEKLRDQLVDFPKKARRYHESLYFLGLTYFHLEEKERALEIWKILINDLPKDRWTYKADWAYTHVVEPLKLPFKDQRDGTPVSLLGKAGYLQSNPDLKGPSTKK